MVNKKMFWSGILGMVLVFGMAVVACNDGSGNRDLQTYPSTLTVTNFSNALTPNNWLIGNAYIEDNGSTIFFTASESTQENPSGAGAKITGSSITLKVYYTEDYITYSLYTGNHTIETEYLLLEDSDTESYVDGVTNTVMYSNKVPIKFTNGSATINFGTILELAH